MYCLKCRKNTESKNPKFARIKNEYSHKFHYYSFTVKLDRCIGSCNTLPDLPNKACNPNKTEDLNLTVFNMIKE